jgi:putative glutathione S-transferase
VVVDPDPAEGRWRFAEPFEGCGSLIDLYQQSGADPGQRATVPALYSRGERRILVTEIARLIELLNRWPAPAGPDLEPPNQQEATEKWRTRLQGEVNDGVYRCGFARTQAAYDRAETTLFAALLDANGALEQSPWLSGDQLSLADIGLFPTLIRLELIYAPLFGCSRLPLWQLPALWDWRRRFYSLPGVAETCFPDAWRSDYFGALFPLPVPPCSRWLSTAPMFPQNPESTWIAQSSTQYAFPKTPSWSKHWPGLSFSLPAKSRICPRSARSSPRCGPLTMLM